MRVLLIEDDPRIARDLRQALEREGYLVEHSSDGEDGWFRGDTEDFAAVVLDLGLPGLDGLSILKRWRASDRRFPILILTARGNWNERVEGIDAGADDYLPKPYQTEELLARLRAIIRRASGLAVPLIEVGPLRMDMRTKSVTLHGIGKDLSPLEYRCLGYLMLNAGRVVSQLELTEQLYAQDFERESNSVEVLIGRLRRKLGSDVIETKRGFGYAIAGFSP